MSETRENSDKGQKIFSRREMIIGGVLVSAVYIFSRLRDRGYLHIPNKWDFLTQPRREILKELKGIKDSFYVTLSYEPIGTLNKVGDWRSLLDNDKIGLIETEASKMKKNIREKDVDVDIFFQTYAVPDSEKYKKPTLDYCLTAYDYLKNYKGIESLVIPDVPWESVTKGEDYSLSWHRKAYIGFTSWNVVTICIRDKQNPLNFYEKILPEPLPYLDSMIYCPYNYPEDWFILISSIDPSNLLITPFSIPITIAIAAQEKEVDRVYGPSVAYLIKKAVVYSAAVVIARDLSHKLKITPAERLIKSFNAFTRHQNNLFDKARQYISTKGLGDMIKHYVEDPIGFTKNLQK